MYLLGTKHNNYNYTLGLLFAIKWTCYFQYLCQTWQLMVNNTMVLSGTSCWTWNGGSGEVLIHIHMMFILCINIIQPHCTHNIYCKCPVNLSDAVLKYKGFPII